MDAYLCGVKKAYIMPLVALGTFLIGTVAIFFPFLPFGWALYAVTALILAPYLRPLRRFFLWLAKKDKSGRVNKIGFRIAVLYRWSERTDLARKILTALQESEGALEKKKEENAAGEVDG